jgi:hypothetical protein
VCFRNLPKSDLATEENSNTMDEHYNSRLFYKLRKSYDDRRNTLSWAIMIWAFTAVGFAVFLPIDATMVRSVGVALGWSAIHLIRRM